MKARNALDVLKQDKEYREKLIRDKKAEIERYKGQIETIQEYLGNEYEVLDDVNEKIKWLEEGERIGSKQAQS